MHKRQFAKNNILLFLSLLISSTLSFAQDGDPESSPQHVQILDNGSGENGGDLSPQTWILEPCIEYRDISLTVAHLDIMDPATGEYLLPEGVPPIMVHYKFGDFDSYHYALRFKKVPSADNPYNHNIYRWEKTIPVQTDVACAEMPDEMKESLTIVQINGEVYEMSEHLSSGRIFDCSVFYNTKPYCDYDCEANNHSNCPTDEEMAFVSYSHNVQCTPSECGLHQEPDHDHTVENNGGEYFVGQLQPDQIHIFPNPAERSTALNLELSETSEVRVTIFNMAGQVVFQQKEIAYRGLYQTDIITQDWQAGIYICHVQYGNQFQSVRLSKL